jgi:hypothetical protein
MVWQIIKLVEAQRAEMIADYREGVTFPEGSLQNFWAFDVAEWMTEADAAYDSCST